MSTGANGQGGWQTLERTAGPDGSPYYERDRDDLAKE